MLTIDRTLNEIWRVRTARPIAQRVLVYWAAATLGPLLLGLSLSVSSYLISASRGFVGALPGGVGLLLLLFGLGVQWVGAAALFRFVPNTHVRWAHALAGGLFVALGFEIAKRLLGWYLHQVPSYSTIYGAFATVPIFLIWLYLGWVIVLLGAVIAAYAPTLALRELAAARKSDRRGLDLHHMARCLNTDPLQVEPLLDGLMAIGWVGRLEEDGAARHVLLCDPDETLAQPLLASVLLDPSEALAGFWRRANFNVMTVRDLIVQ
jgi:membrane protein